MTPHLLTRAGLAALAAGALITLSPKVSRAEQFLLFDVTFDFTWEDAINAKPSQSHYYVKENNGLSLQRPTNWVAPIDYRNGKVHIHLEVLEKPEGGQEQGWALCYVGKSGSYGCPYTDYYTEPGVYDREVDMTNFFNNDTIDWTKGIAEVDLVYTIDGSGHGHVHFYPELKDLTTPTKVRIAMVQVAEGSTYDPSGLPNSGAAGSGGAAGSSGSAGVAGNGGLDTGGSPSTTGGGGGMAGAPGGGADSPSVLPSAGTASSLGGGGTGSSSAGSSTTTTPSGLAPASTDASCALNDHAPAERTAWPFFVPLLGLLGRRARRRVSR